MDATPKRGIFVRLEVYKMPGISRVKVLKRVGKTVCLSFRTVFRYGEGLCKNKK